MSKPKAFEDQLSSLHRAETLRDNADKARVERIWRRLEPNVAVPKSPKRSWSIGWAPGLAAGLVVGFLIGHQYTNVPEATPGKLVAEPTSHEPAGLPEPRRASDQSRTEAPEPTKTLGPREPTRAPRSVPLKETPEASVFAEVPVIETAPAPAGSAPVPQPNWLKLADRGEYQRAYHSLEEYGGFDAVLSKASADELMILADVARATGNRGRAIQALRRVTQSFVSDPNAPIAAMTLGRMLLQAGDSKGASEAFSLYRRLSPEGDFAEDALASDIQAAVEEGNWERAQTLAKQYESDFPDGRHLEQIREQLHAAQRANGSNPEPSEPLGEESEVDSEAQTAPPAESPYQ